MREKLKQLLVSFDPSLRTNKSKAILLILISFLVGIFIVICQRVIFPLKVIRVSRINSLRIGHMLLEIDWYLSSSKIKSIDIFFFSTPKPVNIFLADFARKKMIFFNQKFLFGAYILNRVIPGGERFIIALPAESFDFRIFDHSPSPFMPTRDFEIKGAALLKDLGISLSSPIVCFYIRDSFYASEDFPHQNQEPYSYRDSKAHDFLPAMEYLTSQGYTVIRMGRKSGVQINSNNSQIIDYCSSNYKSDFADFYLISKAKFAICTDSGTTHFALFFRKPIAHANIAGLHGLLHSKLVKFVTFKRYFDVKKNRYLTLREILNSDLPKLKDGYGFINKGIKFFDSAPNEIVGLAKDMINNQQMDRKRKNYDVNQPTQFQSLITNYRGIPIWTQLSHVWLQNNKDFLD